MNENIKTEKKNENERQKPHKQKNYDEFTKMENKYDIEQNIIIEVYGSEITTIIEKKMENELSQHQIEVQQL